ncbi:MAG: D-alanyl-D-alanine carboxypeptidase [Thermomicrobiales bacterium]|nr:D-alanyl-D-alanine carboxypeptidase [Thermomicrobiales bacterium]
MTVTPRNRSGLFLFSLLAALLLVASASAQSESLGVSSKRFIVIDANTGEVIAEQNADERVAIASLTKVFTLIEALERGDLDQVITTQSEDLYDSSSTLMGFGAGETFTLKDLLYGMMLPSGNDAAHAIARALGADEGLSADQAYDNFIRMMNERAVNMGLTNTQFKNPHGWGVEGHYSTARDIATFVMYALQFPEFEQITGATTYTTSNGYYTVINTNRLLSDRDYAGLVGGKTGYDEDAGYCLVEVARRGDTTLISVTLDGVAPDVWYMDNEILLDYGFADRERRATSAEGPIAETLSYVNPDLTWIKTSSASGGSLSGGVEASELSSAAPEEDQSTGGGEVDAVSIDSPVAVSSSNDGLLNSTLLGVIAAGLLIAAVAALKAFRPSAASSS